MQATGSLYIHIPFCQKKCPYCHFFVLPNKEELKSLFMSALHKEWLLTKQNYNLTSPTSIYFGGGTPTKLHPKDIERILSWVLPNAPCEITLEANPEDVTLETMRFYRQLGINRVSVGIQSLNPQELDILGRGHSAQKTIEAIHTIYAAGIDNISIDLMYDIPYQTESSWENTLKHIKDLPIDHLSLYNLTFEPKTSFFLNRNKWTPYLPSDEASLHMLLHAIETLESYGLKRYEISAFAKGDKRSLHNIGYWTARPFLGLGPSAHSYWNQTRWANIAHLGKYAEALNNHIFPIDFQEKLDSRAACNELLAVNLRLLEGVHLPSFTDRHGPLPQDAINTCIHEGYLTLDEHTLKLTPHGLCFYDTVASILV